VSDLASAELILAELKHLGIVLWVEGDRLRYKAPDGGLTPELRTRLGVEKPRLLRMLSTADGNQTSVRPPISPSATADPRPSHAQERLWFLEQLLPGDPTYNMPYAYRMRGALDVDALRRAVSQLVSRHEILRTELVEVDGAARARVADILSIYIPVIEVDGATA
jgi:hypothetical protein